MPALNPSASDFSAFGPHSVASSFDASGPESSFAASTSMRTNGERNRLSVNESSDDSRFTSNGSVRAPPSPATSEYFIYDDISGLSVDQSGSHGDCGYAIATEGQVSGSLPVPPLGDNGTEEIAMDDNQYEWSDHQSLEDQDCSPRRTGRKLVPVEAYGMRFLAYEDPFGHDSSTLPRFVPEVASTSLIPGEVHLSLPIVRARESIAFNSALRLRRARLQARMALRKNGEPARRRTRRKSQR